LVFKIPGALGLGISWGALSREVYDGGSWFVKGPGTRILGSIWVFGIGKYLDFWVWKVVCGSWTGSTFQCDEEKLWASFFTAENEILKMTTTF
jgi:hypothetical protein